MNKAPMQVFVNAPTQGHSDDNRLDNIEFNNLKKNMTKEEKAEFDNEVRPQYQALVKEGKLGEQSISISKKFFIDADKLDQSDSNRNKDKSVSQTKLGLKNREDF